MVNPKDLDRPPLKEHRDGAQRMKHGLTDRLAGERAGLFITIKKILAGLFQTRQDLYSI
jgi:hypothetical protein